MIKIKVPTEYIISSLKKVSTKEEFACYEALLEKFINHIFINLKEAEGLQEEFYCFILIDQLQRALCNVMLRKNITLPRLCYLFVKCFDRLDDYRVRALTKYEIETYKEPYDFLSTVHKALFGEV